MTEDKPSLPKSLAPSELGFTRKKPVQWLAPKELVQTGMRVVLSGIFGAYADKRELQAVMSASEPGDFTQQAEMWIDYVSDLGDGFDATYTVARALAAPTLDIGHPNQRGSVLVLGGDQVYPSATAEEYENRFAGPYRAALPYTDEPHPRMYALPGNHDWYDGLTAFLRVFCQDRWIGGWKTCQTRSYFALQLPSRWWLWGIDVQFDTYIDKQQLEFFEGLAVQPGDSVILCSAKPSWVEANEDKPDAYQTLDFFERKAIRAKQAEVRLSLTGDTHHYARYAAATGGAQKITAGGGGAYVSATHHLPKRLLLPPPASRDPGKTTPPAEYTRETRYPSAGRSRAFRLTAISLLWRNPTFLVLGGALHALFAFVLASALRGPGTTFGEVMRGLGFEEVARIIPRSGVAVLLVLLVVGGLIGFTKAKATPALRVVGVVHAAVHLVLLAAVMASASSLVDGLDGVLFDVAFMAVAFVAGAIGTGLVMAAYLAAADMVKLNANELFAAQGHDGFKCFLRLHLRADGGLTVYPIGIDRVGRRWRLRGGGAPGDPWLEPGKAPSAPRLIDGPIHIEPRRRP
ncbi:MAG: metallophosphoesterase [Actinomycetota bacterium]|nr:metallophosphoesterase [Actinomycetota bacterium]